MEHTETHDHSDAGDIKLPESIDGEQVLLAWVGDMHVAHVRSVKWYLGAAFFILLLFLYSIMTAAWSFSIVIVLMSVVYFLVHHRTLPPKTIAITKNGFQVDDAYTSWHDCEGFWMLQGHGYIELHIQRSSGKDREVVIHTGAMDVQLIRHVLTTFIPEWSDRRERVLDMIARILKI